MAESGNLKNFETAADGDTDEPQKNKLESHQHLRIMD